MVFSIPPDPAVALLGILVQLGACLLATTLVFGAQRTGRRFEYMVWWSRAWIAVTVAIAAIAVRYLVVPRFNASTRTPDEALIVAPLYVLYQSAKLLFVGLTGLGIIALVTERPVDRRLAMAVIVGAVVVGGASVAITRNLDRLLMIQSAVAVPAYGAAAWMVRRLSPSRRGLGSRTLTLALVVMAVQWTFYFQGFALAHGPPTEGYQTFLAFLTGYNSYFDAGQLTHLGIGMVLSLTDWTRREADLTQTSQLREAAAAEARLSDVIRTAHEGIITLDADGRIDLINPAAAITLGIEQTAARGQHFDQFVEASDREAIWAELAGAVRRSEARPAGSTRREVRGTRINGDHVPLEISLSSLGDDSGGGSVLVLRDLTDQLTEREAYEQLRNQLAQTAKLEAMGRMVSGVAHELNNPLTAIIAFAQDLLMSTPPGEDREALTVIMQQADRCRIIVGDLLIFARSGREERRRVTADELARRVARVFDRNSARFGVALDVEVAAELPPIEVDAAGIEQVLTNLLTNALQASPRGGRVRLIVGATSDRVEFRVEDCGPGIAADVMPRLFEPFFTTKAPGDGTGLGLSVSHAIVQQHGGTVTASNRDDGVAGARFVVRLPFVERRAEGVGPTSTAALPSAPLAPGGRALVVDDEPSIRVAIRRALERRGWTVDEAGDGFEAWLHLDLGGRPGPYDVVITDLRMPGMSGIELVEKLRLEHPALADRALVITGDTASPQVVEFLASLKTPCLQKPFDMKTVVEWIERIRAGTAK